MHLKETKVERKVVEKGKYLFKSKGYFIEGRRIIN